jgi:hypothetical protein
MAQRCDRLGLALEALATLRGSHLRREELEGDLAGELGILRAINTAHPSLAQELDEAIAPERLPQLDGARPGILRELSRNLRTDGAREDSFGPEHVVLALRELQKLLDLGPKILVSGAGPRQPCASLLPRSVERPVEESIYLVPACSIHGLSREQDKPRARETQRTVTGTPQLGTILAS